MQRLAAHYGRWKNLSTCKFVVETLFTKVFCLIRLEKLDLPFVVFSLLIRTLYCLNALSNSFSSGEPFSPLFWSFLTNERGEKNWLHSLVLLIAIELKWLDESECWIKSLKFLLLLGPDRTEEIEAFRLQTFLVTALGW
jgi:hypothetical protein